MFRKLHLQMTLFCAAATGAILIALTAVCLFISESSLIQNGYSAFVNETSSALLYLQEQESISLQWLNQLREKNGMIFVCYDNGTPLFSQRLTDPWSALGADLIEQAALTASGEYGFDLFTADASRLTRYTDFSLTDQRGASYYVCAGKIPRQHGFLSFLIFYPLAAQRQQIIYQRLYFAAADCAALFLLTAFSWYFTGRLLRPLAENNRKQAEFIAAASHELRTPLAVLLSGTEALEKATSEKERSHFAGIMKKEGLRMQRLISDMLLLARSDAASLKLQTKICQPDELVLATYEKYELLAQKRQVALALRLPENPPQSLVCDEERILQVLSILLDNALSYTPAGGSVTLSLSSDDHSPAVLFSVSDTGPGIPDAEKKHVFERFYRAESSRTDKEHFGLGLCIAKEITDAHHGKITVTDTPGGGACFRVTLPV